MTTNNRHLNHIVKLELFLLWNKCEGDEIFEQWSNKEEFKIGC